MDVKTGHILLAMKLADFSREVGISEVAGTHVLVDIYQPVVELERGIY